MEKKAAGDFIPSLTKSTRELWRRVTIAAVVVGIGLLCLDRYTDISAEKVILFLALVAAGVAAYQAHKTRIESLMPMLIVGMPDFVPMRPRQVEVLATPEGEIIGTIVDPANIGPLAPTENAGVGPAIQCTMEGWIEPGVEVATFDASAEFEAALRSGPCHYYHSAGGIRGDGGIDPLPWLSTGQYTGPYVGGFRLYWRLVYYSAYGKRTEITGVAFFESNLPVRQVAVAAEDQH